MELLNELAHRNLLLFVFGSVCMIGTIVTGVLIFSTSTEVLGINAYIKPFKFFLSTVIFTWSMAWYVGYLNHPTTVSLYAWTVILVLSFELIYITWKASQGDLSHFNISSAQNAMMFRLMGIAISIMTLFTLYIGILFFLNKFPDLPPAYLWGIRLGIILFVVFAFEGGIMGAKLAHTVGAPDGGAGLKLLNWSTKYGDLRIAHFLGMHALQVLPLIGYYLLSSTRQMAIVSAVYFLICTTILVQALMKIPLIRM